MPLAIVTSIISALSIVAGSLVGALCSWIINRKMHQKKIQDDYKMMEENHKYEEGFRLKELCNNANIIRLDIATALFQSIRSLKNKDDEKKYLYLLPINKNYSLAIVSLSDKYNLRELSLIYQLYGIIEKVNRDIFSWSIGDDSSYEKVLVGFKSILYKLYGENYRSVLKVDPDKITYEELYNNQYAREEYKSLLIKLDNLCLVENLTKEELKK